MDKKQTRLRRARKTRAKIAELKVARLCVHRSNSHIYAQIIDGEGAKVVAAASTVEEGVRKRLHSIAPASCITVASRRWPKPRVKADSSSKRG